MDNPRFAPYIDRFKTVGCCLDEILLEFSIKDSAEKRFDFARELMKKHGLLPEAVHKPHDYKNTLYDSKKTLELRRIGSELLKDKNYTEALIVYTESIKSSEPGTECHSHALASRSVVMFYTEQYHLCLNDIRRAMLSQYPIGMMYKLYQLAGDSESYLGHGDSAKKNYLKCLEFMDKTTMTKDAEQKLRLEITNAIKSCESLGEKKVDESKIPVDKLLGGSNDKIPAFSKFLELKNSPNLGRGVYATCDINPGDY